MRRAGALPAAALAGVLALAGCAEQTQRSTMDAESRGESGPTSRPDYGVTPTHIRLGVLNGGTRLPAEIAAGVQRGYRIWVSQTNEAGGICDRRIRLASREEPTAAAFAELEPQVLGLLQIPGSPLALGLDEVLVETETTGIGFAATTDDLANPYVIVPGATADLEMINGLAGLMERGVLRDGDPVGYVGVGDGSGPGGRHGLEHFAKVHGLVLHEVTVNPADTDLLGAVGALAGQGVRAIALGTPPALTAAVATANQQLPPPPPPPDQPPPPPPRPTSLNLPLLGTSGTFDPGLLAGPAAPALAALTVASSTAPFASDLPAAAHVANAYPTVAGALAPSSAVHLGYAAGQVWGELLRRACENEDLTRAGIQEAARQSTALSTGGLLGDLDLSQPGLPTTREAYLAVPDPAVPGGLRQVKPLFAAPETQSFPVPGDDMG